MSGYDLILTFLIVFGLIALFFILSVGLDFFKRDGILLIAKKGLFFTLIIPAFCVFTIVLLQSPQFAMSGHYFMLIIFICLGMLFCGFTLPSKFELTDDFGEFLIFVFTALCVFAIMLSQLPKSSSLFE